MGVIYELTKLPKKEKQKFLSDVLRQEASKGSDTQQKSTSQKKQKRRTKKP